MGRREPGIELGQPIGDVHAVLSRRRTIFDYFHNGRGRAGRVDRPDSLLPGRKATNTIRPEAA
jgi:hypothetical protein